MRLLAILDPRHLEVATLGRIRGSYSATALLTSFNDHTHGSWRHADDKHNTIQANFSAQHLLSPVIRVRGDSQDFVHALYGLWRALQD